MRAGNPWSCNANGNKYPTINLQQCIKKKQVNYINTSIKCLIICIFKIIWKLFPFFFYLFNYYWFIRTFTILTTYKYSWPYMEYRMGYILSDPSTNVWYSFYRLRNKITARKYCVLKTTYCFSVGFMVHWLV